MVNRKRPGRWLFGGAVAGLVLVVGLAVWSEVAGFYYNEKPYSEGTFFMLDRSTVSATVAHGDDGAIFTGIPLYVEGWNRVGSLQHAFTPREWWPRVGRWNLGGRVLWHVRLPLWIPLAVCTLTGWWAWRICRRFGPGRCSKCGYDVRGVTGGRCPECGLPLQAAE